MPIRSPRGQIGRIRWKSIELTGFVEQQASCAAAVLRAGHLLYPGNIYIQLNYAPGRPVQAEEGRDMGAQRDPPPTAPKRQFRHPLKFARTPVMHMPQAFLSLSFRLDLATRRR